MSSEQPFQQENENATFNQKIVLLKEAFVNGDLEQVGQLTRDHSFLLNTQDKCNRNLLQKSIIDNDEQLFDCLLSLNIFDLEYLDKNGQTALDISLRGFSKGFLFGSEYVFVGSQHFPLQLLRKGANYQNFHLYWAILRDYFEVADLLVERGININNVLFDGFDHFINYSCKSKITILLSFILRYGANPWTRNSSGYIPFEDVILTWGWNDDVLLLENLFLCTFDKYTAIDIHLTVLIRLAKARVQFFQQLLICTNEVILEFEIFEFNKLFRIDSEYFLLIMQKCGWEIMQALSLLSDQDYIFNSKCNFENLNYLLESEFRTETLNFINTIDSTIFIKHLILDEPLPKEPLITGIICFLLSYGLKIQNEIDLQIVYNKFGLCDLFKILLHFDFVLGTRKCIELEYFQKRVMPIFYYNVCIDLDDFAQNPKKYAIIDIHRLLDYFADFKMRHVCCVYGGKVARAKSAKMCRVPLLLQLARDTFRKYLLEEFQIQNSKQFYTIVNHLPIGIGYKKIITYESRIY